MTIARVLLALDDAPPVEVAWAEVEWETKFTAVPSLLRLLADKYDVVVADLLPDDGS